jgi:hypothetical protein
MQYLKYNSYQKKRRTLRTVTEFTEESQSYTEKKKENYGIE